MVKRCAWGTCNSDTRYPERLGDGVYFLPVPKPHLNPDKCLLWIKLCGRPQQQLNVNKINKDVYICSKHFVNGGPSTEFPHPHQATRTGSTVGQKCRLSPKKRCESAPRRTKKDRKIRRGVPLEDEQPPVQQQPEEVPEHLDQHPPLELPSREVEQELLTLRTMLAQKDAEIEEI
ncbi:hypothetical protein PFLUV_G00028760 [Perca fluviatilis]|uniref:THAP-type domain-containing protein n=1 Tax=Perca fluviatilis TaxID=8168 RepID=A0A6A5FE88_PERFL|nr:hypothetical protein PFLUV_G00028760 [Perca fluviatilis]